MSRDSRGPPGRACGLCSSRTGEPQSPCPSTGAPLPAPPSLKWEMKAGRLLIAPGRKEVAVWPAGRLAFITCQAALLRAAGRGCRLLSRRGRGRPAPQLAAVPVSGLGWSSWGQVALHSGSRPRWASGAPEAWGRLVGANPEPEGPFFGPGPAVQHRGDVGARKASLPPEESQCPAAAAAVAAACGNLPSLALGQQRDHTEGGGGDDSSVLPGLSLEQVGAEPGCA